MQKQVPAIPVENYLIEPAPRGTASVVALAAAVLQKRDPQAMMAIQTSDHYIRNRDLFHYLITGAVRCCSEKLSRNPRYYTHLSFYWIRIYSARRFSGWQLQISGIHVSPSKRSQMKRQLSNY